MPERPYFHGVLQCYNARERYVIFMAFPSHAIASSDLCNIYIVHVGLKIYFTAKEIPPVSTSKRHA